MNRESVLVRTVLAAGLALALGAVTAASAQQSSSTASASPAAAQSAAPAEQPRRRDRRRNAEAPVATAAAPTPTDKPATAEENMICKNIKPIGSRVARRMCATEEQWAAANEQTSGDANESMRQMRDRSGIAAGSSSGPASLGSPAF